ncbi:MAG: ral stress protein 26 [Hyphomicrobiales bacterium]|jgi:general stress protein 26|nr:ral stress protein 26 [Hyphomicrobiales bacterium]
MVEQSSSNEDRAKVWDLVKDMRIAMLVTKSMDGSMHSRPMASVQKDFDGRLWFMCREHSLKVDEIERNPDVLLAYSHSPQQHYVSIRGAASVVRDRAKINELWSEADRVWFPKGPDDPEIALLAVDVEEAEYWDAPSSAMVIAYGYAKARLSGEPPKMGENKVVKF